MSQTSPQGGRPDARATSVALTLGTVTAVALFVASFALRLIGQPQPADVAGTIAVVALLATPVVGLGTTSMELRKGQGRAWALALLVLCVLAVATVLALANLR